jgi:hypothetical protein
VKEMNVDQVENAAAKKKEKRRHHGVFHYDDPLPTPHTCQTSSNGYASILFETISPGMKHMEWNVDSAQYPTSRKKLKNVLLSLHICHTPTVI